MKMDDALADAFKCERCVGAERWYVNKSAWIRRHAKRHGVDMDVACTVYAVMSANQTVAGNDRVFLAWLRTGEVFHFGSVERRVRLAESGDIAGALTYKNAAKIVTFRDNLRWPKRFAGATIDRHMGDIVTGDRKLTKSILARVRLTGYRMIETIVVDAARRAGLIPSAAQARVWVHWVSCLGHGA